MNFTVETAQFQNALKTIIPVIPAKHYAPHATEITVKFNKGLLLSGTNTEVFVNTKIKGVKGEGSFNIPGQRLYNTIQGLPDKNLDIRLADNKLTIDSMLGNYTLPYLDVHEYELPDKTAVKAEFKISGDTLKLIVNTVLYMASNNDNTPELQGVRFDISEEGAWFVAFRDNRNMAAIHFKEQLQGDSVAVTVPTGAIKSAAKMFGDSNSITITITSITVKFSDGVSELTSRILEDKFLDFRFIIGRADTKYSAVDRLALINSVKRVTQCTGTEQGVVALEFSDDALKISSANSDGSSAIDRLDADYKGEPQELYSEARWILENLTHLNSEEVELGIPFKAMLFIRPVNPGGVYILKAFGTKSNP